MMIGDMYNVKRSSGEVLYSCTGKRIGVFKRRKAKRYQRPGVCKVKVIKQG